MFKFNIHFLFISFISYAFFKLKPPPVLNSFLIFLSSSAAFAFFSFSSLAFLAASAALFSVSYLLLYISSSLLNLASLFYSSFFLYFSLFNSSSLNLSSLSCSSSNSFYCSISLCISEITMLTCTGELASSVVDSPVIVYTCM